MLVYYYTQTFRPSYSSPFSQIPDSARLSWASRCSPRRQDEVNDILHSLSFLDTGKDRGPVSSHELRITVHNLERSVHERREIDLWVTVWHCQLRSRYDVVQWDTRLIDDQQIRLRDTRTTLARDLVPSLWVATRH